MDNYNQKDQKARRYALVITLLLLLLLAILLGYGVLNVHLSEKQTPPAEIVIEEFEEFEEEIVKPEKVQTPSQDVRSEKATTAHVEEASIEQHEQTEGAKPETQTLNTNALFKPVVGNVEELQQEGNRLASNGEQESSRGDMGGYNLLGSDQLDEGLQGRGLREGLPKPRTSFNMTGRVVVYVHVNSAGDVISAVVEQRGTTTSNGSLHDLAIEAAMKAKFKPSDVTMQSGWITYDFKVK